MCTSRQIIVQLISVNFESNKAERYTEPSRIKRLPDVGMVKVYPKCVLTAANVDRGCYTDVNVNLWGLYVGCSVKEAPSLFVKFFSPAGFSCKATRMFEDTLHHPYILLVFAENIFSTLIF